MPWLICSSMWRHHGSFWIGRQKDRWFRSQSCQRVSGTGLLAEKLTGSLFEIFAAKLVCMLFLQVAAMLSVHKSNKLLGRMWWTIVKLMLPRSPWHVLNCRPHIICAGQLKYCSCYYTMQGTAVQTLFFSPKIRCCKNSLTHKVKLFIPPYKQLSQIKRAFQFQLNIFGALCPLGKPVYLNNSEFSIKKQKQTTSTIWQFSLVTIWTYINHMWIVIRALSWDNRPEQQLVALISRKSGNNFQL